jgi:hypothetical protein
MHSVLTVTKFVMSIGYGGRKGKNVFSD